MAKGSSRELNPTPFSIARQFTGPPFSVSLESAELRSRLLLELARESDAARPPETAPAAAKPKRRKTSARRRSKVKATTPGSRKKRAR